MSHGIRILGVTALLIAARAENILV